MNQLKKNRGGKREGSGRKQIFGEKKSEKMAFSLSISEKEKIRQSADQEKKSVSAWILSKIF